MLLDSVTQEANNNLYYTANKKRGKYFIRKKSSRAVENPGASRQEQTFYQYVSFTLSSQVL
jgi:hypothetical protein